MYRCLILVQHLVVLGHGDAEYDRGHILEAVDPFLSLRPLATHVEQSGRKCYILSSHKSNSLQMVKINIDFLLDMSPYVTHVIVPKSNQSMFLFV